MVLSNCASLELTIDFHFVQRNFEVFNSTRFFDNFNDCIQKRKRNVKIEVKHENKIIGTITKGQVIWRKSASELGGTFTITDEFFTPSNIDYKQLNKFVDQIINLNVNIYHFNSVELRNMIDRFQNLNKLYMYIYKESYNYNNQTIDLVTPQEQRFIYDGFRFQKYSELCELSDRCPDLETLELERNTIVLNDCKICNRFSRIQTRNRMLPNENCYMMYRKKFITKSSYCHQVVP